MSYAQRIFKFSLIVNIVGLIIMIISMMAGEYFIREDLFRNFTQSPIMWGWISIEFTIAFFPIAVLGFFILYKFKNLNKQRFLLFSTTTWISLFVFIALIYRLAGFVNEWSIVIIKPGVIFGWFIPGTITLFVLIWFSHKQILNNADN